MTRRCSCGAHRPTAARKAAVLAWMRWLGYGAVTA
jgi:hypothetical protein